MNGTKVQEYNVYRCWNLRLAVWSCKCALDARRARGNICVIPKAKQVVRLLNLDRATISDITSGFEGYWVVDSKLSISWSRVS